MNKNKINVIVHMPQDMESITTKVNEFRIEVLTKQIRYKNIVNQVINRLSIVDSTGGSSNS